ncbi:MAG: hypothetical protein QRY16_19955 [Enterobacterales bacterium endosymbiont of Blomia tropicalis]|uniref:hypothetical protein n=1 Tax=Mixta mediterraneensis TaxID=2758443 RepID=UPI0025A6F186|nr:hypothetical protein [Mixta mediterraneensis]MDL4915957.1 hypothetical protein [Mixta mediterraneensis]
MLASSFAGWLVFGYGQRIDRLDHKNKNSVTEIKTVKAFTQRFRLNFGKTRAIDQRFFLH